VVGVSEGAPHEASFTPISWDFLNQGAIFPFWEALQIFTKKSVTLFGQIAFILVVPVSGAVQEAHLEDAAPYAD
jgi:hypothetical protein